MTRTDNGPYVRATGGALGTLLLLGVFAVAAPPAAADDIPDGDGLARFHDQRVDWAPCPQDHDTPEINELLAGLECADVAVPLDYDDPGGEQIEVAVSRSTATDPDARRGVLLLNPGGPGGDALWMPGFYADQPIAETYDLIGFDPRGVGESAPLTCEPPEGYEAADLPSRPSDAQLHVFAQYARDVERGCEEAGGAARPHIHTAATARDMDVIRAVLGEEKINYLGYSYGTYLGAVYGSLFPQRLDRSVLDSSVHPHRIWYETWLAMAPAYTANVRRFAEWAAEEERGLGGDPKQVRAAVEDVADQLHEEPVGGVNRTAFDAYVGLHARYQSGWGLLADILVGLRAGGDEAEEAAAAVAAILESLRGGAVGDAYHTIACEADYPRGLGRYYWNMRWYREKHPYGAGVSVAAPSNCTFRSYTPSERPVWLRRHGYPTGLVVQAEYDTQTVYDGGPAMARRLGHRLLTVTDDGGHALYAMPGYDCVTEKVNDYLVDGALPGRGAECAGLPRPETGQVTTFSRQSLTDRARDFVDTRPDVPIG